MKFSKNITINIGQYESLKLGVEEAPNYRDADKIIIAELKRLEIPVSKKIMQCLQWKTINKNTVSKR
jgi:hypothetical protein